MASELETVISEWWFINTIRAMVLDDLSNAQIEYGRYFIRYDKAENIIYVS